MASKANTAWLIEEVADLLAASPSTDELLAFRPSARTMRRFNSLLANSKSGSISEEEEWELNQFEFVEMLMQSIKARLRPTKPVRV